MNQDERDKEDSKMWFNMMIMIGLVLLWVHSCVAKADPNDMTQQQLLEILAANWLDPAVPIRHVFIFEGVSPFAWKERRANGTILVIRCSSPAWMEVTGIEYRPANMLELADLSRVWKGDPNYVAPEEPNEPTSVITTDPVETPTMPVEPNAPEPNQPQAQVEFCWTVGGKDHLFEDCRYIVGKEYVPCLCEPGNMCLTCVARAARE